MNSQNLAALICFLITPAILSAHDHSRLKGPAEAPRFAAAAPKGNPELQSRLTIELKDAKSGQSLAGLIRIADSTGKYLALPGLPDRMIGLRGNARQLGWHVLMEKTILTLPRAQLKLEALSGLDSELESASLDLRDKASATQTFNLKRFFDAKRQGLASGNTHLHLMKLTRSEADTYLQTVPRGDGVDLVFVSYLERADADKSYVSNEYSHDDLAALSSKGLRFGDGEEYRHNIDGGGEGWGHVMFLNLKNRILPASLGPGITKKGSDGTSLRSGIQKARSQSATIIWCHNAFGFEDIPNWAEGLVDAQNIFDGGTHGGYKDTFYRYLNAGFHVPFSTGTDWFIYDFSRVYVPLAEDAISPEAWLKALASGRSMITNSTLLTLDVANEKPGDTIRLEGPGTVTLRGTAVGRVDFGQLQLIRNGEVATEIKSIKKGRHFEARLDTEIALDSPAWLALRIAPDSETRNELGKAPFAHTSPVYVEINGKGVFQPETVRGLITEIRKNMEVIQVNGKFNSDNEKESILQVYLDGIKNLEQRIRNHSEQK